MKKTPSQKSYSFVSLNGNVCYEAWYEQVKKRNGKKHLQAQICLSLQGAKTFISRVNASPGNRIKNGRLEMKGCC